MLLVAGAELGQLSKKLFKKFFPRRKSLDEKGALAPLLEKPLIGKVRQPRFEKS